MRNVEFIETAFTGGMDLIVVRYSEEWVSTSSHSPVEGEWPVVVRTPPLVENEAPFQNT
jgi:hypothetical protein